MLQRIKYRLQTITASIVRNLGTILEVLIEWSDSFFDYKD
jgi:hypothetical protein